MNVQTLSRPSEPMSIDEFFDWIDQREEKYELVDGVPILQPWVKRNHNRIVMNIVFSFSRTIDASRFEIATGDFAIPTGPRSIRYADVLVELAGGSGQARTTETATVIVEVLSPSTENVDFGPEQREYSSLPTLADYLIVSQDERRVWQWTRGSDGGWPAEPRSIRAGAVDLSSLGASLTLDEIYRNVS